MQDVNDASVEELLPAYAADELPSEHRARVEAALAESPRLRDEVTRYERLFVLLAAVAAAEVEVPADLQDRIIRRVAFEAYLSAIARLVEGLLEDYKRAVIDYLGGT